MSEDSDNVLDEDGFNEDEFEDNEQDDPNFQEDYYGREEVDVPKTLPDEPVEGEDDNSGEEYNENEYPISDDAREESEETRSAKKQYDEQIEEEDELVGNALNGEDFSKSKPIPDDTCFKLITFTNSRPVHPAPTFSDVFSWRKISIDGDGKVIYKNYNTVFIILKIVVFNMVLVPLCAGGATLLSMIIHLSSVADTAGRTVGSVFLGHLCTLFLVLPLVGILAIFLLAEQDTVVFNLTQKRIEILRKRFFFQKKVFIIKKDDIVSIKEILSKNPNISKWILFGLLVLLWVLTWGIHLYLLIWAFVLLFTYTLKKPTCYMVHTKSDNHVGVMEWEKNLFQNTYYVKKEAKRQLKHFGKIEVHIEGEETPEYYERRL